MRWATGIYDQLRLSLECRGQAGRMIFRRHIWRSVGKRRKTMNPTGSETEATFIKDLGNYLRNWYALPRSARICCATTSR